MFRWNSHFTNRADADLSIIMAELKNVPVMKSLTMLLDEYTFQGLW